MFIAAVTGTNGKTSTVRFAQQLMQLTGIHASSYGTLGLHTPTKHVKDPLEGAGNLALPLLIERLRDEDSKALFFEAYSSALARDVLIEVVLNAAAFTNFERDHLDFHKTMNAYYKAKRRLFNHLLPEGATAVLNTDIPQFEDLYECCIARHHHVVTYGKSGSADIQLVNFKPHDHKSEVSISFQDTYIHSELTVTGHYMIENVLCAIGLCLAAGLKFADLAPHLKFLTIPPGRLEHVMTFRKADIFIDYAHTPGALSSLLHTLRKRTKNRLVIVFGCGGNRDKSKRQKMGRLASELADIIIVTDDNPRNEDPASIRRDIMKGCPHALSIPNRKKAIEAAVNLLKPGDVLVVAGKGHETHQAVEDKLIPFNDRHVIEEIVFSNEGQ